LFIQASARGVSHGGVDGGRSHGGILMKATMGMSGDNHDEMEPTMQPMSRGGGQMTAI